MDAETRERLRRDVDEAVRARTLRTFCIGCGAEFTRGQSRVYCSAACRRRSWQAAQRAGRELDASQA